VLSLEQTVAGFAQSFTTNRLCVNKSDGTPVCVTGDQLAALLAANGNGGNQFPSGAQPSPAATTSLPKSVTQNSASTTPPTITINGNNPMTINVGDTYADLGATVTDNVDQNLGLKYFLNGVLVSNIVLDTSAVATDTIDYVATDSAGNTATSTRTVIVEVSTSTDTTTNATSTDAATSGATSTAQ